MFTIAVLCAGAQIACNEVSLVFSRAVSTYYQRPKAAEEEAPSLPITNAERRDALDCPQTSSPASRTWLQKSYEWAKRHSPVQPITNDEYRQRLLTRQNEVDAELRLIEAELQQKRSALQALDA
ncbi:hypothetical protein MNAN1_002272 [Malassezia nana]|uniref:Uncharacterized protein n=1 Tax=Malassezia nana TaxID=180528 RepID=A0AAF0J2M9_9BASI|nr:hypothetical protein MNAN1_002272 [Malassezia nana]